MEDSRRFHVVCMHAYMHFRYIPAAAWSLLRITIVGLIRGTASWPKMPLYVAHMNKKYASTFSKLLTLGRYRDASGEVCSIIHEVLL